MKSVLLSIVGVMSPVVAGVTCGLAHGYDRGVKAFYYSGDGTLSSFEACSATCLANTECQSFAFGDSQCLLYSEPLDENFRSQSDSPFLFYDRGCELVHSTSSFLTTLPPTTVAAATATGAGGDDAGATTTATAAAGSGSGSGSDGQFASDSSGQVTGDGGEASGAAATDSVVSAAAVASGLSGSTATDSGSGGTASQTGTATTITTSSPSSSSTTSGSSSTSSGKASAASVMITSIGTWSLITLSFCSTLLVMWI